MPNLAILSPLPPFPPLAGGTAHMFQAARQLARFYQVSVYALAHDPALVQWGPMPEWCADVRAFPLSAGGRPGIDPPAVRMARSPELRSYLQTAWAAEPPDIVQLEFTDMAQYAPLARKDGALVVCTAHNVAFLAQARRARRERSPLLRARRTLGAVSLWRYELAALRRCDLVVTLGDVDAAVLRRWLPGLPVVHVPSGIDLAGWPPCFDAQAQNEVLFVGNYGHPPNVEGALWLAREVWPLVRAACPNAVLTLAGRDPTPDILALAGPHIRVPGTVADLRPLYARSSVVAAPIFWGGGVRVKLLEALAGAMPIVTTGRAAEGLALEPGRHALFAERPAEFAAAIARLLGDQALRLRLSAEARVLAERRYDWAQLGRGLAGLYEGARARLHRMPNQ